MLDPALKELLTVPVSYEKATSARTKYGQEQWADPVTLLCYVEFGLRQIEGPNGTIYTSRQTLIFDGSDAPVQGFALGDRFTAPGIGGGQALEAVEINSANSPGPSFRAPMSTWLVEVVL